MIKPNVVAAVFEKSLQLKAHEKCLIITDALKESIARPYFEYARLKSREARMEVIPPLRQHGAEPAAIVAKVMLDFDVVLLITAQSLSHTKARRDATARGARIASMPSITGEIMNRSLDVDYDFVKERSMALYSRVKDARTIRVQTALGTDILFERGSMKITHGNGGVFNYAGAFGNLPEGEVSIGPQNANGRFVIDASIPCFGKLRTPLTVDVKDCFATCITGERSGELIAILDAVGKNAYRIAELGIGTHPNAIITGVVLEDEKVSGTCHIAFGNNMSFGGTNDVPIHLDGVIRDVTITADGEIVMDKGIPLF
jgi:leucyl aminopeptidase (aminopeptidase T)